MPYSLGSGGFASVMSTKGTAGEKVQERIKPLAYNTSVAKLLLDLSDTVSESSAKETRAGVVEVVNTGKIPALIQATYNLWTDEDTMSANVYSINYLLVC